MTILHMGKDGMAIHNASTITTNPTYPNLKLLYLIIHIFQLSAGDNSSHGSFTAPYE